MLYYDRIDISEEMDPTKNNISKKCIICHYWFFNHGFEFSEFACNGCHDLTILRLNISDIAIITVENLDYCCIIHTVSKSEAISILKKICASNCGSYGTEMLDRNDLTIGCAN